MATFIGVVLLGAVSPGPDFFVLTHRTATSGRTAGLACATGMGTGILTWAIAVSGGLAALVSASVPMFTAVKLAGAVYLVLLGLRTWLRLLHGDDIELTETTGVTTGRWRSFREGLICNLLNPKVAVFYLALMPQFVPHGSRAPTTMLLAVLAAATVLGWYLLVTYAVSVLRGMLTSRRVRRGLDATTGAILIGLGIKIAST
ncbi:LysE family translocator [Solicola gregarius]|uniref:LysE family translocator n=1 Tax=Solicola gregarius TaxID=2908642 RepID=A0AA46TJ51_9ACTN|nr:LysE family translocator [Solicola gregarius]UYM06309.1 LysE family translocator [Solicola gregarius]